MADCDGFFFKKQKTKKKKKIKFATGYGCLWWLIMGVCGSGWWVASILWLFVVVVEVSMWWLLRWVCGGWVF